MLTIILTVLKYYTEIMLKDFAMDIRVDDRLEMKKNHPCGGKTFLVLRVGMDFRIRCEKCGHEMMLPRGKVEKNIKKVISGEA